MKITKQLEAEIKQVMNDYWNSYFEGKLDHWANYLVPDYRNIGGTEEEIWNSKKEILDYTNRIIDQMQGTTELRNKQTQIIPYDPYIMVHELLDIYIKITDEWTFYQKFRLSSLIQKTADGWKVLHQHGSYPDSKTTEGEAFAFDTLKSENIKLQKAISERTIELEQKNNELAIEAALQRVRTVAMSMSKTDDLLNIAEIVFKELQALGFTELRNAIIQTFVDDKKYFNDYDFSDVTGGWISRIPYTGHPIIEKFVKNIRQNNNAFVETVVSGKEMEEWMEFRKANGEVNDPRLDGIKELFYYHYSIGEGDIGISTFSSISAEKQNLLKRFRNVFDLAYKRYIDITKAEAQAKEAQLETSLERVRAQAMAMRTPEELTGICEVLYAELHTLGFAEIRNAMINIHDDEKETFVNYDYSDEIGKSINHLTYNIHPLIEKQIKEIRNAEGFSESSYTGKDLEDMITFRKNIGEKDDPRIEQANALYYYFYSIGTGSIGISTFNIVAGEKLEVLKRFRNVFTLAYQRYTDIAQAEAQAREAQIELGLERVRARAMAMQKSDELSELVDTVFKELTKLDLAISMCIINIIDESSLSNMVWAANPDTGKPPESYLMKFEDYPFHHAMMRGYKERATKFIYVIEGEEKKIYDEYLFTETEFRRMPMEAQAASKALKRYVASFTFSNFGGLQTVGDEALSDSNLDILARFGKVFDLTYTRFNDLQKAEAQAREAQIELALERVRARSMAMQKSDELQDTSLVLFEQLKELGEPAEQCTIGIIKEFEGVVEISATLHGNKMRQTFRHKLDEPFVMNKIFRGWKDQQRTLILEIKEEELQQYNQYRNELVGKETFPVKLLPGDRWIIHIAYFSKGMMALSTNEPRPAESLKLLERFAIVFEQTYTRFLDLQKAEAQAREAHIEAALEKVRSRSLAMHTTSELGDVVTVIVEKLKDLGVVLDTNGVVLCTYFQGSKDVLHWIASLDFSFAGSYLLPYFDHPIFNDTWNSKESGAEYFSKAFSIDEKNSFFEYAFEHSDYKHFPDDFKKWVFQNDQHILSFAWQKNSAILIPSHTGVLPSSDDIEILKRFAKVFEQSYVRFLDLRKAEAQAREALIEASLERVRASAMAMHHSTELTHVLSVLFEQFDVLGICPVYSQLSLLDLDTNTFVFRCTGKLGKRIMAQQTVAIDSLEIVKETVEKWKNSEPKSINEMYFPKEVIPGIFELFKEIRSATPPEALPNLEDFPDGLYVTEGNCQFGYMGFAHARKATVEEKDIVLKFATEFGRLYQRFLDLQKAESQAKEAQIETALERVRSRTMGMQKSEELKNVIKIVYQQLIHLKINLDHAGFVVDYKPGGDWHFWIADEQDIPSKITHPYFDSVWANQFNEAKEKGADFFTTNLNFEEKNKFYNELLTYIPGLPETSKNFYLNCPGLAATTVLFDNVSLYFENFSGTTYTDEENIILMRFGKVFQQTYTRFLDLQKAELQTRQAKIETALEKVRARALAMQQPEELIEVAEVLRHEMGLLGVEELETCSIYIHDETINRTECWYALKDIQSEEKKLVSDHFPLNLHDTWVGKEMKKFYMSDAKQVSILMQGANRKEWIKYCEERSIPFRGYYGEEIPDRTYHLYKFSHGALGAASAGDISAESWDLLQRAASVFSLAYSRFKDLTQARFDLQRLKEEKQRAETALSELQTTQKQLIQSEKMASLGELTAGIAHEIQNPLNFVNNFSEVSNELMDEMNAEIAKGDFEEAKLIANDIKQNLEKINHHGKRADAIVKGMLQHSRSSSATKEPTDINKLADEYLRLAYHGLRAKDKSFNATMKTDFDESIDNINIIPQDIGRVILNLITNAFFAASLPPLAGERFPNPDYKYNPTVWVSTKKVLDKIEIKVRDNGPGIPQKILDKIFQPFFTTKPTGQGTGLGLSLSYDIVKAHGGELKVETREGDGSTFIIVLPNI